MEAPDLVVYSVLGFSILFGIVQCFYGYRIFNILLGIIGFIFGGVLLGVVGMQLSGNLLIGLIAGLVGGVVGAALLVALHFLGVFIIGATLGALVSAIVLAFIGMSGAWIIMVPFAVLGGAIALFVRKPMIIISMALVGASSVVVGALGIYTYATTGVKSQTELFAVDTANPSSIVALVAWGILSIVGIVFQFRHTADKVDRPKPKDRLRNTVLG